jgi:hypothetical protein
MTQQEEATYFALFAVVVCCLHRRLTSSQMLFLANFTERELRLSRRRRRRVFNADDDCANIPANDPKNQPEAMTHDDGLARDGPVRRKRELDASSKRRRTSEEATHESGRSPRFPSRDVEATSHQSTPSPTHEDAVEDGEDVELRVDEEDVDEEDLLEFAAKVCQLLRARFGGEGGEE